MPLTKTFLITVNLEYRGNRYDTRGRFGLMFKFFIFFLLFFLKNTPFKSTRPPQVVVYSLFSIILGVILSFIWAIIFGLLKVISTYVLQPASKVFFILLRVAGMICKALIGSFCDPCYRSFALIFSRINVAALTATEARPVGMRIHNSNLQIV